MNYDLAKQLKEAGWEFNKAYITKVMSDSSEVLFDAEISIGEDLYLMPTLEELIKACGDDFHALKVYHEDIEWTAMQKRGLNVIGKTPREAVAKLWLELNKKETPHSINVDGHCNKGCC